MSKANHPFQETQRRFAAHIRDPDSVAPPPDVEDRRMAIYRELLFNNISSLVATGFPVLRQLYSDAAWNRLIRRFMIAHRCQTPLFPEVGQEFIAYLQQGHAPTEDDPPFLLELAHYEWVELALAISEEQIDLTGVEPNGDLLETAPVISPLAWPLSYQWPVQEISGEYRPSQAPEEPTYIVVYRDRHDQIGFLKVNPVSMRLINLLEADESLTGRQAIERIAEELRHPNPQAVLEGGRAALDELRSHGVILGTRQG
jgi:hypothetical protein